MKGSYLIKSINRSPTSLSSSNFSVQITPNMEGAKKVRLKYLSLPNTIYNISSSNNSFSFTDPTNGAHIFTIPPGNYTVPSLTSTLAQLMTSISNQTYSVTYSSSTYFITISAPTPFSLQLNIPNSSATALGFLATNTSTAASFTGTKAVNLQANSIYISVAEFYNGLYVNSIPFSFIVPITTNSTGIALFNENSNFHQEVQLFPQSIYNLTITLFDEYKNIIDLNSSEWEMLLEFE